MENDKDGPGLNRDTENKKTNRETQSGKPQSKHESTNTGAKTQRTGKHRLRHRGIYTNKTMGNTWAGEDKGTRRVETLKRRRDEGGKTTRHSHVRWTHGRKGLPCCHERMVELYL